MVTGDGVVQGFTAEVHLTDSGASCEQAGQQRETNHVVQKPLYALRWLGSLEAENEE